jgi:MFS family permease
LTAAGQATAPEAAAARTGGRGAAYAVYFLVILLLANTLSYADRHLFAILLPAIKADFGASDGVMGLIAGPGFIVSYILLTMPLARLADRWSRRRVLALSAATWSLATGLCGYAAGLWHLTAARVIVGVGEAGGMPPSQSMLADLFSERRRTTAMGVLSSGTYLGILLGLAGGAAIASAWGWRAAFWTLALPGIPVALLLWFTGPRRSTAKAAKSADSAGAGSMLSVVQLCWRIPSLRFLAIGMGVFNIYGYAGAIWMPAYFMRSHGMTMLESGAWLGIGAAAGGVLGSFASGAIVDALIPRDRRWQLRVPAAGFLISFPLFLIMLMLPGGASVALLGQNIPAVALLSLITAFLSSLWMGPSFAAASRLLVVIINVLGSAMGPLIAGAVSDLFTARLGEEALRYSLLAMSGLTALGGLIFWRAASHYPRDLGQAT